MDKNVSSVDLEELMKAREELDREKGIETDPNMYSDYNPDRQNTSLENSNAENFSADENHESTESLEENSTDEKIDTNSSFSNALDEEPDEKEEETNAQVETSETQITQENSSSQTNYDIFSAFEVKENANYHGETLSQNNQESENKTQIQNEETGLSADSSEKDDNEPVENLGLNPEEESKVDEKLEKIENSKELEEMLSNLLDEIDEQEKPENQEKQDDIDMSKSLYSTTEDDEDNSYISQLKSNDETSGKEEAKNEDFGGLGNLPSIDIEPKFDNIESETSDETIKNETEKASDEATQKEDDSLAELSKKASENDISDLTIDDLINSKTDEKIEEEKTDDAELSNEENASIEPEETSELDETQEKEDAENSSVSLAEELEKNIETQSKSIEDDENDDTLKNDSSEILNVNELNEESETKTKETEAVEPEPQPQIQHEPKSKDSDGFDKETEIITDYNQLRSILQNELKESETVEEEKLEEKIDERFSKIDDFKFINEIATDEFKNSDKFSYILGKNEKNELVFGNFKNHYNLAVFGKNDGVVNSFLNSMILSLCLKNSVHDVNFVLLDSDIDSAFEVYNKSSYLYFNRIAKTNKEILDTLIEVSKEVDSRYEKLAEIGVKNIEKYNDAANESGFLAMPYIVLVFNNYTSASQATDNDRINACLYQILKFGRIAGVYCVVTAKLPIETSQINYNLSSRLSFKSDEDSRYTVGESGAESLPAESDAIYFNISSNGTEHIKTATVTDTELDLIIKDLED